MDHMGARGDDNLDNGNNSDDADANGGDSNNEGKDRGEGNGDGSGGNDEDDSFFLQKNHHSNMDQEISFNSDSDAVSISKLNFESLQLRHFLSLWYSFWHEFSFSFCFPWLSLSLWVSFLFRPINEA